MAPGPQQQRRSIRLPALFCLALLAGLNACAPQHPPPAPAPRTADQKAAEPRLADPQAMQVGGQAIPSTATAAPRPPDDSIIINLPCPSGPAQDTLYAAQLELHKPGRLALFCIAQDEAKRHDVAFSLAQYRLLSQILLRIEEDMFPPAEPGYDTRLARILAARPKLPGTDAHAVMQRVADSLLVSVDGVWLSQASLNDRRSYGLALSHDKVDDMVRISEIRADTSAAKAGLTFGMQVLRVGDQAAKDFRLTDVDSQPAPLVITYRAADGSAQIVSLPSDPPQPPGRANTSRFTLALKDDIALITLANFGADVGRRITTDLAAAPYREARGYVLDLRNNLGGLLDQVVAVADVFLDRGEVGRLRGRPGSDINNSIYNARTGDLARGKPLLVLTNRFTGSGAEMLAAALADNSRATLIGETTAGLLRIETIFPIDADYSRFSSGLPSNSNLRGVMRLRTALVQRPNGAALDSLGVTPSIAATDNRIREGPAAPDRIMERALAELRRMIGQ